MHFLFDESQPKKVCITVTCSEKKSHFVGAAQGVCGILLFISGLSEETNWKSFGFVGKNE